MNSKTLKLKFLLYAILSSLLSFIVIIFFFSPSFVYWKGLLLIDPPLYAEIGRAYYTLQQLDDPFISIPTQVHKVIQWRLLFPIIGYSFNFSPTAFLSLPFIGSIILLATIYSIVKIETSAPLIPIGIAILMGTASWFFVSTGWLAYFDSWYLLGLMAIGFMQKKKYLIIACILTPWIDERFIIALPITLIARQNYFPSYYKDNFKLFLEESLLCFIIIAPYLLLRIIFALLPEVDANTVFHIQRHWSDFLDYKWNFILGLWHGLRGGWILIFFFIGHSFWKHGYRYGIFCSCLLFITIIINKILAHDFSRSVSVLIPVALMGAIQLIRFRTILLKYLLPILIALNLLSPAKHVVSNYVVDIMSFPTEYKNYFYNPPSILNPERYFKDAFYYQQNEKFSTAYLFFTNAIRLDKENPDYYYARGLLLKDAGTRKGREKSCADFARALEVAGKDWEQRDEVRTEVEACHNLNKR